MSKPGRPALFPNKKIIGFSDEQVAAVEEWRREQTPIPNFSEAIRRLVEKGLSHRGAALF